MLAITITPAKTTRCSTTKESMLRVKASAITKIEDHTDLAVVEEVEISSPTRKVKMLSSRSGKEVAEESAAAPEAIIVVAREAAESSEEVVATTGRPEMNNQMKTRTS